MAKGYKGCEPTKNWFHSSVPEVFCNMEEYRKTMDARLQIVHSHRTKYKNSREFQKHVDHITKINDGFKPMANGKGYVKLVKKA
jgi:hypothetical protein